MEFTALPPEVTSALIHSGPGADSLIEASGAWQRLATSLEETAAVNTSTLSSLTGAWHGASAAAMTQAVEPYLGWLRTTAQQCQQMAVAAQDAVAAYNSARSSVVPVASVSANRTRLAQLLATNRFGINLPAIAHTEDEYLEMWANNSGAMSRYEAASAQATTLPKFSSPLSITNPAGTAAQATATPGATITPASILSAIQAAAAGDPINLGFADPTTGYFGLVNQYVNQFISSGFPINLLSYAAQNTSAQALQTVGGDIGTGLSEGQSALGAGAGALGGVGRFGAAGLSAEPTAAIGIGVSMGKLTAPPAVVGLLPASQVPVQLTSAATPIVGSDSGFPMPPLMPPPISSAGSGWRKRKEQKYEDISIGAELKGTVMPRPPSAG
jgi:PPE-repeat protein